MGRRSLRRFWKLSHDLEALAQLKLDLHEVFGRLITQCYDFAKVDPTCADYWQGEGAYWDGQYREAIAVVDKMIELVSSSRTPARATVGGRDVEIANVQGDVIITQIGDNAHDIAVGKDLKQDVSQSFPGKREEDE